MRFLPSFKSREERVGALFRQMLAELYTDAASVNENPIERLETICQVLTSREQIEGAAIVVLDREKKTLEIFSSKLAMGSPDPLRTLRRELANIDSDDWHTVPSEAPGTLYGRRVPSPGATSDTSGILLIQTSSPRETNEILFAAVERLAPLIGKAVAFYFYRLGFEFLRRLRQFTVTHFCRPKPDLQATLAELQDILQADSVVLFLKEYDRLHHATTADKHSTSVFNLEAIGPGSFLSNRVVEDRRTVELIDGCDEAELAALSSSGASPGKTAACTEEPCYVLGLPLFSASPNPSNISSTPNYSSDATGAVARAPHCNGALWIARRARPFARIELRALEDFAVELGTTLARLWKIHVGDSLWQAGSEAVVITRREKSAMSKNGNTLDRLVDIDQAAERLFGGDRGKLIGKDGNQLYDAMTYKRVSGKLTRAIQDGIKEVEPTSVTIRQLDGNTRSAEASYRLIAHPFIADLHYTASVIRDTTDRQKILDQHRRLVELLAKKELAYFAANEAGFTTETSPAEEAITGFSADELRAMNRADLYPKVGTRDQLIKKVRREGGRLVETVQKLRRKDGAEIAAHGFIRLLIDSAGNRAGAEGIYVDATDKIRLQELLGSPTDRVLGDNELYERLKEDTKLNLDYMTSLSHQISTPLSALAQNLFDLKRALPENSPHYKRLEYLSGQTKVCRLLVENLSYIDRILKGEDFAKKRLAPAKIAVETAIDFKQTFESENLDFRVDSEKISKLVPEIQANPALFRQVIVNLVDNAIKYSKPHTSIRFTASRGKYENFLELSNVGIPIPKEHQAEIFSRGFRNPKASAHKEGTGLGLWIVQKILERHGFRIQCRSEESDQHHPFELVTFRISIPMAAS